MWCWVPLQLSISNIQYVLYLTSFSFNMQLSNHIANAWIWLCHDTQFNEIYRSCQMQSFFLADHILILNVSKTKIDYETVVCHRKVLENLHAGLSAVLDLFLGKNNKKNWDKSYKTTNRLFLLRHVVLIVFFFSLLIVLIG